MSEFNEWLENKVTELLAATKEKRFYIQLYDGCNVHAGKPFNENRHETYSDAKIECSKENERACENGNGYPLMVKSALFFVSQDGKVIGNPLRT